MTQSGPVWYIPDQENPGLSPEQAVQFGRYLDKRSFVVAHNTGVGCRCGLFYPIIKFPINHFERPKIVCQRDVCRARYCFEFHRIGSDYCSEKCSQSPVTDRGD